MSERAGRDLGGGDDAAGPVHALPPLVGPPALREVDLLQVALAVLIVRGAAPRRLAAVPGVGKMREALERECVCVCV